MTKRFTEFWLKFVSENFSNFQEGGDSSKNGQDIENHSESLRRLFQLIRDEDEVSVEFRTLLSSIPKEEVAFLQLSSYLTSIISLTSAPHIGNN